MGGSSPRRPPPKAGPPLYIYIYIHTALLRSCSGHWVDYDGVGTPRIRI